MSAFQPFLQYFATGSDTASCQDYARSMNLVSVFGGNSN